MRRLMCLVCVLATCVVGMAHTVETLDGTLIEGSRIVGLPGVLTLDDDSVIVEVEDDRILALELAGGVATITTTTSERLSGTINLQISAITVKTETGETTVPIEQVAHVVFDRGSDRQKTGSASVQLKDGREYQGDLANSFPDELTIESGGISTSTRVRSMTSIEFGDPTTIETTSGTSVGTLRTGLPASVELETQFGSYRLPTDMITEIQLTPGRSTSIGEASTRTIGVGFKIWQSLPFITGNLSLNNFGAELAVGFGSMTASGSVVDMTALWYSGSLRYVLLISGLENFVRPYLGVGIVGVTAVASAGSASASASVFGFDAGAGLDIPLAALGIPLTLSVGSDWSFLAGASSLVYQLGIRLDFNL